MVSSEPWPGVFPAHLRTADLGPFAMWSGAARQDSVGQERPEDIGAFWFGDEVEGGEYRENERP